MLKSRRKKMWKNGGSENARASFKELDLWQQRNAFDVAAK
jgi:hypothetical protein